MRSCARCAASRCCPSLFSSATAPAVAQGVKPCVDARRYVLDAAGDLSRSATRFAALWQSWGVTPAAVLGHSVGEFIAATVAGLCSFEDGLRLVLERARLMQSLPEGGGMLAVAADETIARRAADGETDGRRSGDQRARRKRSCQATAKRWNVSPRSSARPACARRCSRCRTRSTRR